jgi:hypothetical protein
MSRDIGRLWKGYPQSRVSENDYSIVVHGRELSSRGYLARWWDRHMNDMFGNPGCWREVDKVNEEEVLELICKIVFEDE